MSLPRVPCECGVVDVPRTDVRHLSPTTDEIRYVCTGCGEVILTVVLGEADEVDKRGAELGGHQVVVDPKGAST